MNFINVEPGDLVVVKDGQLSVHASICRVNAPPTALTVSLSSFSKYMGGWNSPSRKDRSKIVGKLRSDITPEQAVNTIEQVKAEEQAAIREARQTFSDAIGALTE